MSLRIMLEGVNAMMNRKGNNKLLRNNYTTLDVNTSKVLFTTPQVCSPGLHGLMQEKDYIVADFKHLQAVQDPAAQNRIISLLVVYLQKFLVHYVLPYCQVTRAYQSAANLLFHWCSFCIPLVRPELHFGSQHEYILHLHLCHLTSSILCIGMLLVCSLKGSDPLPCSFEWGQCIPLWAIKVVHGLGHVVVVIVIIIIIIIIIISVISRIWLTKEAS